MNETMRKAVVPASVKATGERTFETTITTGAVDRERDVIDPAGWHLANYLKSGAVVLWAHDYTMPPIAKSLEIRRTATGLVSVDQFPPRGIYPFADQIHDLVGAGLIRAKSVGFIPIKQTWNAQRNGWDIQEAELLEHSYVSVPANPDALVRARSKGLDRVALDRFFGTPRGSDLLVDPDAVRLAVRRFVESRVHDAMQGQRLVLAVETTEPWLVNVRGQVRAIEPRTFAAAFGQGVGDLVGAEMRRALNRLLGRVD